MSESRKIAILYLCPVIYQLAKAEIEDRSASLGRDREPTHSWTVEFDRDQCFTTQHALHRFLSHVGCERVRAAGVSSCQTENGCHESCGDPSHVYSLVRGRHQRPVPFVEAAIERCRGGALTGVAQGFGDRVSVAIGGRGPTVWGDAHQLEIAVARKARDQP